MASISNTGIRALAETEYYENVTTLKLRCNDLGPNGVAYLSASKCLLNIQHLNLSTCKLNSDGIKNLIKGKMFIS